jgi:hypothetical protein
MHRHGRSASHGLIVMLTNNRAQQRFRRPTEHPERYTIVNANEEPRRAEE